MPIGQHLRGHLRTVVDDAVSVFGSGFARDERDRLGVERTRQDVPPQRHARIATARRRGRPTSGRHLVRSSAHGHAACSRRPRRPPGSAPVPTEGTHRPPRSRSSHRRRRNHRPRRRRIGHSADGRMGGGPGCVAGRRSLCPSGKMTSRPPNVAVLGGGMAGLAAAWRLTEPRHRDRVGEVTVYQRGWRLGGKAASHRGVHDRIEEHGLHIWLGYYDNAFRLMRDCYAELDRPTTDPHSSIQLWTDAFTPAPLIGLEDLHDGDWSTWTALFPSNNLLPGEPLDEADASLAPSSSEFLARSLGLMRAFVTSLEGTAVDMVPAVALAAGREAHRLLDRLAVMIPIAEVAGRTLAALNATLQPIVQDRDASRRLWHLADL